MKIGGQVYYDYQYQGQESGLNKNAKSDLSPFVKSLFGEDMFSHVTYVNLDAAPTIKEDLRHLRRLPHLKRLRLVGGKVSADGLANLSESHELEYISLGFDLKDEDLAFLSHAKSLRELY